MIALLEYLFFTSMVVSLFPIAIMLFKIVAYWFLFEKAGEDGWKALVPFYNSYILCKISKKEKLFWLALGACGIALISPLVISAGLSLFNLFALTSTNLDIFSFILGFILYAFYLAFTALLIVISIKVCLSLAEKFGQSKAFGIGLFFLEPIFIGILAFGKSSYIKEEKAQKCLEPITDAIDKTKEELKDEESVETTSESVVSHNNSIEQ